MRVAAPPTGPVVVFDRDCGFCRYWIARWREGTGDGVEYLPFQDSNLAIRFPELSRESCRRAVQLVQADGAVVEGAQAVFRALALHGRRLPLWLYERMPGAATLSERAYRLVADHRPFFWRLTVALWGRDPRPSTYALTSWLFLRLLAIVYIVAFWSLATQVRGLIGRDGILPAHDYMTAARAWAEGQQIGLDRFRLLPTCVAGRERPTFRTAGRRWPAWTPAAVAMATVPVSFVALMNEAGISPPGAALVAPLVSLVEPLRSVNTYGLFAVMTTTRPEIIVEGSDNGETWLEYEFKDQPGDVRRRPPWVAPHQPRLDWQMWFAALGRYNEEAWFQAFCLRLLEGSPPVLQLLAHDPFHGRPPRFVRGVLYRYRFTDAATDRSGGAWWAQERVGLYLPPLSLAGFGTSRAH